MPEFITIVATEEYREGVYVVPPVVLSNYFIFLYSLFCNIEFAYDDSKSVMKATLFASILNIVLNLWFIPIFGYIAAGYTTLVSYIVLSIVHYYMYKKICITNSIGNIYSVRTILGVSIGLLASCLFANATIDFPIVRYCAICGSIIIAIINRNRIIVIIKGIKSRKYD